MFKKMHICLLIANSLYAIDLIDTTQIVSNTIDTNTTVIRYENINNSNIIVNSNGIIKVHEKFSAYVSGIEVMNMNDTSSIINSGNIEIYNTISGLGILAHYMKDASSITNNGSIKAYDNNGSGFGIYTSRMNDISSITNNGNIEVYNNNDGLGILVYRMDDTSKITNSGNINVYNNNFYGFGILVYRMDDTSKITNDGSIKAYNSGLGIGIRANILKDTSSIINNGSIKVYDNNSGSGGYGIFTYVMYGTSNITNNRNIKVYNNKSGYGIFAENMIDTSSITNSGNILVDNKVNAIETQGVKIDISRNNNLITNTGLIKATIDNNLDKKAYSIYLDSNSLRINNSGELQGNLKGSLEITNSGSIYLPSNTYGLNKTTIKSLNQTNEGVLHISVKDTSEYSQLNADNIVIEDGSNINFISNTFNLNDIVLGSYNDILTANTNLNVDTSKLTSSAFLDVNFINNGLSLDAKINSVKTASDILNGIGFSKNQTKMIDKLLNSNYTSMNTFKQALLSSPSKQSLSKLIQESTSEVNSNLSSILQSNFQSTSSLISSRQQTLSGLSSGDGSSLERGFWIKPYHSYTKQDNVNGISGYSLKTSGLGVGIDKEYKANNYYGLALLVSNSDIDMNDVKQYNDVTNFGLMFYSNINNIYENINLYYQLGYSLNDNHSSRYISSIDKTAIGDFKSHVLSLNAKAQKDIRYNEHTIFKPYINTTLLYLNTSSYKESGADSMNLDVESNDDIKFILTLGNEFDYAYTDKTNFKANLSASYDFTNDSSSLTSSYEGASDIVFDTDGLETKALSFNLGLGIDTKYNNSTTLSFNYDTNIKQDFINHNLFAKLRVVF